MESKYRAKLKELQFAILISIAYLLYFSSATINKVEKIPQRINKFIRRKKR